MWRGDRWDPDGRVDELTLLKLVEQADDISDPGSAIRGTPGWLVGPPH